MIVIFVGERLGRKESRTESLPTSLAAPRREKENARFHRQTQKGEKESSIQTFPPLYGAGFRCPAENIGIFPRRSLPRPRRKVITTE
jgi:hypothetical protein